MNHSQPVRRALISVSDKAGIVSFAQALQALGVEILSTGGTAKLLAENHISVLEVADYTGFPEIMAGRLKTLHPKIHGGLLGRRGIDDTVMQAHNIGAIDLLVINLYPFEQTIALPDCDLSTAIENIDIGGPAMLRAAAKNYAGVTVLVDSDDYATVLQEIRSEGGVKAKTRFNFAAKAFAHTARYDAAIANYLGAFDDEQKMDFPLTYTVQFNKYQDMRYGENPHQKAAFYVAGSPREASIATARQLQGKALSYNNIADSDAALECVKTFTEPACVIVKHANPCGVALGADTREAYGRAFATDPTSAFGGIIAFNRSLDAKTAQAIISRQFIEVIIAPAVDDKAQVVLQSKANIRVLACGTWGQPDADFDYKRVTGGLLIQDRDLGIVGADALRFVSQRQPQARELADMLFAWKVVKFVKSNAIVYARDQMTIGIGAGQMSRVYSARIAAIKAADANLEIAGSVMASDAFFPFRDGIDTAAELGIKAVIQPGGSMRDDEIIAAADEHNLTMAFTGMRHFRH